MLLKNIVIVISSTLFVCGCGGDGDTPECKKDSDCPDNMRCHYEQQICQCADGYIEYQGQDCIPLSVLIPERECFSGSCCDGQKFLPSTKSCDQYTEYRCTGEGCGQTVEVRHVTKYCSGQSSYCDGSLFM